MNSISTQKTDSFKASPRRTKAPFQPPENLQTTRRAEKKHVELAARTCSWNEGKLLPFLFIKTVWRQQGKSPSCKAGSSISFSYFLPLNLVYKIFSSPRPPSKKMKKMEMCATQFGHPGVPPASVSSRAIKIDDWKQSWSNPGLNVTPSVAFVLFCWPHDFSTCASLAVRPTSLWAPKDSLPVLFNPQSPSRSPCPDTKYCQTQVTGNPAPRQE